MENTTYAAVREQARQRSLERIRQMIEREADVDETMLEVEKHGRTFRDIYSGARRQN